jgi:hypothetical protein
MIVNGNGLPITNCFNYSTVGAYGAFTYPVTMRSAPTASSTSGTNYYRCFNAIGTANSSSAMGVDFASQTSAYLLNAGFTGLTAGQGSTMYSNNASSYLGLTAEL